MKIRFVEGPNGRQIPLQKVRNVYVVHGDKAQAMEPDMAEGSGKPQRFVSHFETCPNASAFSRGRSS